jgi:hypothetical protein
MNIVSSTFVEGFNSMFGPMTAPRLSMLRRLPMGVGMRFALD